MLSQEEIKKLKKINFQIVKEAFDQAEKRLKDVLDTKQQIEQKAFILFNGYLTSLIGEISAAFVVKESHPNLFTFLAILIPFFVVSLSLIALSFNSKAYGTLGSNPSMWLEKDILEGNKNSLKIMLGYVTFHHQNRIKVSIKSNNRKLNLINYSSYISLIGLVIALFASFLICFFRIF